MDIARIICFGNSITAAYGMDPYLGFPSLLQDRIDSLGLPYRILNAGISGETTAGGNERVDYVLEKPCAVFILELGLNDLLLGVPAKQMERQLGNIIRKVKKAVPGVPILLLEAGVPPQLAGQEVQAYRQAYDRLAKQEDLHLLTDCLAPIWADPSLLFADGLHPNAAGQARLTQRIWEALYPLL